MNTSSSSLLQLSRRAWAQRGNGPYAVTRDGLLGFTRSIAVDYGHSGLTANYVCLGATDMPLTALIPDEGDAS